MKKIKVILKKFGLTRGVLAVSIARMGDGVGNGILILVFPLYVAQVPVSWLHVPESVRVGLLISLFGIASSVLQLFTGALTDRSGKQKLIIIAGLSLFGLSTLFLTVAKTYEVLLLIRLFQGVGFALTIPASVSLLTLASRQKERGRSMGFYTTLRVLGISTGPLLGGLTYMYLGFSPAFLISAGFIFLGVLTVIIWVRNISDPLLEKESRPFRVFERGLFTSGILGLGFATFTMACSFSMIITLEKQFNSRLNETAFAFGTAVSALMLSRIILQLPLGWLSDKVGRKIIIISGLLLMVPATYILGIVDTTLQLAIVRIIQGAGSAAIAAPAFALAGDLSKSGGRGRQMSVLTIGFGFGVAMGPLLTGFLVLPFFQLPFITFAGLLLLSAWVVYHFVPETVKKEPGKSGN